LVNLVMDFVSAVDWYWPRSTRAE